MKSITLTKHSKSSVTCYVMFKICKVFYKLNQKISTNASTSRWAGHVARMGEEKGVYRVLVGKPEGRRPVGRPRRRWVDNIRRDLQEV